MNASEARSEAKPSAVNAVAVIVDATSKWQADGRNTRLAHGRELDASALPLGVRFGIGGALALEFAREGYFVALTTRAAASARGLAEAVRGVGRRVECSSSISSRPSRSRARSRRFAARRMSRRS